MSGSDRGDGSGADEESEDEAAPPLAPGGGRFFMHDDRFERCVGGVGFVVFWIGSAGQALLVCTRFGRFVSSVARR